MELQLRLALPSAGGGGGGNTDTTDPEVQSSSWLEEDNVTCKRRRFVSSLEDDFVPHHQPATAAHLTTLPLLQLGGGGGHYSGGSDDDNVRDSDTNSIVLNNRIETEEEEEEEEVVEDGGDGIVGWPPIRFRPRKKRQRIYSDRDHCRRQIANQTAEENSADDDEGGPTSVYVKVTMDGVGIGRKVDVGLCNSFDSLKRTLFGMFGIQNPGDGEGYQLTYQDAEGDWLLADDISWRSFVGAVQRLRLMRNCSSGSS